MKGLVLFSAGIAAGVLLHAGRPQTQTYTVRDFPNLTKGLLETPGCLGVKTFPVDGGKQVAIAAWFENRKAMEAWYYGQMHQEAMTKFFPKMGQGRKPFAEFKDEKTPMLVVASVTPGDKPVSRDSPLNVAQIAIEAYAPIPGGVAFGGTFAPEKLQVPGLVRIPIQ